MKLHQKVPLSILAIMFIIGVFTGASMLYIQRQAGEQEFEQMATDLTGIVESSLELYMKEAQAGDETPHNEDIEPVLTQLAEEDLVNNVIIYNKEGSIAISGSPLDDEDQTITDIQVQNALQTQEVVTELRHGRRELSVVTPVWYQDGCSDCHTPDNVIGAIELNLDTGMLADREQQQVLIMLFVGGITFLLVGGAATYVLRTTILSPLRNLERSAESISNGDYSARARVRSNDEIGTLSTTFNEMADRVESRTQEIELLNSELEDRVIQRTDELSALNAVISTASKSLNVDTILNDTLDKVLSVAGMDAAIAHLQGVHPSTPHVVHKGVEDKDIQKVQEASLEQCPLGNRVLSGISSTNQNLSNSQNFTLLEGDLFKSQVSIPIKSKGKVLGALCLFDKQPRQFDSKAIQMLETMGEAIGVSVEHAQTAERLKTANLEINSLLEQAMNGGFDVRYQNPNLVKCWEERGCQNTECPCYGIENTRCWQIVGSFSSGSARCQYRDELESCIECHVYQKGCLHDNITAIGENFNNAMFLLEREAQRREQVRQQLIERIISAQEEERKRIARELHDETGQALTAIMMEVARTQEQLPEEMKEARKGMSNARSIIGETLGNLRKLISDLRPEVLDDLGLVPALRSYVKNRLNPIGIKTTFEYQGSKTRLPSQVEVLLFRVVQEAITNIVRHAQADTVDVSLEVTPSLVMAIVKDNGKGFDAKQAFYEAEAWGLRGMHERVSLLGGQLTIESTPGKGTQVYVEIPLEATASE